MKKALSLLMVLLLAVSTVALVGCDNNESRYNEAISLMEQGEYEEALTAYNALSDYEKGLVTNSDKFDEIALALSVEIVIARIDNMSDTPNEAEFDEIWDLYGALDAVARGSVTNAERLHAAHQEVVAARQEAAAARREAAAEEAAAEAERLRNTIDGMWHIVEEPSMDFSTRTIRITGVLRNDSGVDARSVFITFYIYDRNGNRIGNARDSLTTWNAGDTWRYEATFFTREESISWNTRPTIAAYVRR